MTENITWSGKTSSYHHKWNDTPNPETSSAGVRKVWYLDAQWSTCPVEVEDQVQDIWRWAELGNDTYMYKTTVEKLIDLHENPAYKEVERWVDNSWQKGLLRTNAIVQYLREQGVQEKDEVVIHWWW